MPPPTGRDVPVPKSLAALISVFFVYGWIAFLAGLYRSLDGHSFNFVNTGRLLALVGMSWYLLPGREQTIEGIRKSFEQVMELFIPLVFYLTLLWLLFSWFLSVLSTNVWLWRQAEKAFPILHGPIKGLLAFVVIAIAAWATAAVPLGKSICNHEVPKK